MRQHFPGRNQKTTNGRQSMQKNDLKNLQSQPKTQPQVNVKKQAFCRNPHIKKLLQTVLSGGQVSFNGVIIAHSAAQHAQRKLIC